MKKAVKKIFESICASITEMLEDCKTETEKVEVADALIDHCKEQVSEEGGTDDGEEGEDE